MNRIFKKFFWQILYYDVIWGVRNLFTHFKVVWNSRPWDFNYSPLEMLKFKLEELVLNVENGWEEEESKNKKVKDIKRCIELIDNRLKDNYIERVGGLNSNRYSIDFIKVNGSPKLYQLQENRTQKEIEEDESAYHKALALDDREWYELWDIIKINDARGWWD